MIFCGISPAQNASTWFHHGNYSMSTCLDLIELSDGNLVVKEAVYDNNGIIGVILYKMTVSGYLLNSLFVAENYNMGISPMLRDPSSSNSNIMTSFYMDNDDNVFYKAVYFTDNLEITDETIVQLPPNIRPNRFLIDNNNDIITSTYDNNKSYNLIRIGLDGEIKKMSETIAISPNINYSHQPLALLSTDPQRYLYASFGDNYKFEVFDADLNKIQDTVIKKADGWTIYGNINYNVFARGDGYFYLSAPAMNTSGRKGLIVVKFNSNFETVSSYVWGVKDLGTVYPYCNLVNKNLIVTDNNVFVAWREYNQHGSIVTKTMMVTRLDSNLNYSWDSYALDINKGIIANYGMTSLSNGGVAISGWLPEDGALHCKDIYAIIYDNYLSNEEIATIDKPFICYPNPTKDVFIINFFDNAEYRYVDIYSLDGHLVATFPETSQQTSIDISDLNSGVYIMKIKTTDGKEYSEKIIKE